MLTAADFEDADLSLSDPKRPELVTGIHCFVAFAELSVILNEILSVFFTVSSVVNLREVTGDHIIEIHDRINNQLEIWRGTYLDQILSQRFFPDVTGRSGLEQFIEVLIVDRESRAGILDRPCHVAPRHLPEIVSPESLVRPLRR